MMAVVGDLSGWVRMGLLDFEKSFQEGKQQVVLACPANFETNGALAPRFGVEASKTQNC